MSDWRALPDAELLEALICGGVHRDIAETLVWKARGRGNHHQAAVDAIERVLAGVRIDGRSVR